jgi:undecaprenyl-diphosphatase
MRGAQAGRETEFMDLLEFWRAALMGLVEGLTEFLPVSSTGHLILLSDFLGFEGPGNHVFEIVIQLGAILAVCWLYWGRLFGVARTLFSERRSQVFTRNLLLAFIPSMVIGVMAYSTIKAHLMNSTVVAIMLIVGGIAILVIERMVKHPRYHDIEEMPAMTALKIGLFQCVSMIPGVSRAGATIMGALLVGVERKAAAEFSFFLAIPTMAAATVYDLYKNRDALTPDGMELIAIGFIVAFFSALIVVKLFIGFVSRYGFAPFAWYRIVIGALMLGLIFMR